MQRISTLHNQLTQNQTASDNVFSHMKLAPVDPILGTSLAYKADKSKDKMNLGVGAYRDDNEKPYVFKTVKKAEEMILGKFDKEYLTIDGWPVFNQAAQSLLFGAQHPKVKNGSIFTTQTISGTGACRVGFEFCKKHIPGDVYVSNPTWGNHNAIIKEAGLTVKQYPYWDAKSRGLDFKGMTNCMKQAAPGSIFLLHACAHNPTGVDPTQQQWKEILQICQERSLFPFLDSAYQGYASGDLEKDAWAVRLFLDSGIQFVIAQSFAKNMGLYGERAGALHFVCASPDSAKIVGSQVKLVIRPMYSNPPMHPSRIAGTILANDSLRQEWIGELKMVADRILKMRSLLRDELVSLGCPGNWDHIVDQIGMFSYTGLSVKQCEHLINKWHIYMLKNGRISMAGITTKNVKYLANAIKDAVLNH